MTDIEILIFVNQISEALGVDGKPMLEELPEIARKIKRNADRYAKLKKLLPADFSTLRLKAWKHDSNIDDLIDALPEKQPLSADKQ